MTETPGDDVAEMDQDAGSTVRSDDEGRPDLPGVGGGDVDPIDGGDTAAPGADDDRTGLGDADDVEAGAGAIEPPD
jgi:hypothetical protein